jgi:hypothetical protein
MPIAVCRIRTEPHYRHDAFHAGLRALGYEVTSNPLKRVSPDDVLVIWNRTAGDEPIAKQHEGVGSSVIVVENGYLDAVDGDGHQWFTMSMNRHNGAGDWPVGGGERWLAMNLHLAPWRPVTASGHILVVPQRGIGQFGVAMPRRWTISTTQEIRVQARKRRVQVRVHPGSMVRKMPLEPALEGCHAVVTWGSSAALKAMQLGVPAFHDFPRWIGGSAAVFRPGLADLENPLRDDGARLRMFECLAWSQWTVAEIASGEAISMYLESDRAR